MKTRLLPLLSAALLTSCVEKAVQPPEMLRLHVTSSQILSGTDPLPGTASQLTDWLAPRIEQKIVDHDVRMDFDYDVPVWRMVEMIDAVCGAGAYAANGHFISFAFNMEGRMDADIPIIYPPEEESMCCAGELYGGADEWGEFMVTEEPRSTFVDFDLTINEGTLLSGDTQLTMDDLKDLLRARRRTGEMRVTITEGSSGTAADLLPALTMCVERGAWINFGVKMPPTDVASRDHQRLYRQVFWRPCPPVFPARPLDEFIRTTKPPRWPLPPSWFPAQVRMQRWDGGGIAG